MRGLSPLYVAIWAGLAAVALAYLALMVVRPQITEGLFQRLPVGAPEDNRGQRAMAKLATEIRDLKQTVKHLETELVDLRLAATSAERTNAALVARLATVETGLKSVIGPQSRLTAVAPDAKAKSAGTAAVAGFLEERPTATGRQGDPTRSAAAAAVAAAPGRTVTAAAPNAGLPSGVQLASAPSLDALRLSWQLVQESHKSLVRGLEPRVVETPGDPPSYRLIAGPMASSEDADRLCERLRTRRVTCAVVPFAGKPL